MDKLLDIIGNFGLGLLFSAIYLGISFLLIYYSLYLSFLWFLILALIYIFLIKDGDCKTFSTISITFIIVMCWHYKDADFFPLWVYIVINSITCLNIIVQSLLDKDKS